MHKKLNTPINERPNNTPNAEVPGRTRPPHRSYGCPYAENNILELYENCVFVCL